jgi:hypothetical protein
MADQIVITEKTSQAKDIRTAVGSRYGDILATPVEIEEVNVVARRLRVASPTTPAATGLIYHVTGPVFTTRQNLG